MSAQAAQLQQLMTFFQVEQQASSNALASSPVLRRSQAANSLDTQSFTDF